MTPKQLHEPTNKREEKVLARNRTALQPVKDRNTVYLNGQQHTAQVFVDGEFDRACTSIALAIESGYDLIVHQGKSDVQVKTPLKNYSAFEIVSEWQFFMRGANYQEEEGAQQAA
jgi:hypothetical protein